MLLYAIIFSTGAAILALELLASRIMTPYFGVSLYIWTGILSITLVALALGYWLGGRVTHAARQPTAERLAYLYLLQPAWAALTIVAACLVYPYAFHWLADFDLVAGAFAACLILLFLPLVTTAAMNPLLVAIFMRSKERIEQLDAGSGRVFFVSTVGSVAGVLITAFGLIPYVSNYTATLIVAAVLALLSLAAALRPPVPIAHRGALIAWGAAASIASLGLLWQSDRYLDRMWPAHYAGTEWHKAAEYSSMFGTVKVLEGQHPTDPAQRVRVYFQDGLIQNTVDASGRSMSLFTYALEALAVAYAPKIDSALVLGLGAGIVPMKLAGRGARVEAVDIDPVSFTVAARHFGFDPGRVRTREADARTVLRHCRGEHDVVIVDLFHGDGVPDYLVTRDFFRDLRLCLENRGIAVFNTFIDLDHPKVYAHFLVTLHAEFPEIVVYRPESGSSKHLNSFVVVSNGPLARPRHAAPGAGIPEPHRAVLAEMLTRSRKLDADTLRGGRIVTDARNFIALEIAEAQLSYRRLVVESVPPAFLIN
jgi:spermidine synthase